MPLYEFDAQITYEAESLEEAMNIIHGACLDREIAISLHEHDTLNKKKHGRFSKHVFTRKESGNLVCDDCGWTL